MAPHRAKLFRRDSFVAQRTESRDDAQNSHAKLMIERGRNVFAWFSLMTGCMGSLGKLDAQQITKWPESEDLCVRTQIERGKPRPVIDGIGWVVGIPSKIILWDRRVDNHNISPETEAAVTQYVNDSRIWRKPKYDSISTLPLTNGGV